MNPDFEENLNELPEEVREPLLAYMKTRSDADLSRLVWAALSDFSDQEIPKELPDETSFLQDLGLDSLTITELVFFFEDIFSLEISNEDLLELKTVGDMKKFLRVSLAS